MQPQPAIWSAIYRRRLLLDNGIDFLETPGAAYQDTAFNYKVWATANRVFLLKRAFAHYRQDNISSSINSTAKVDFVRLEFDSYFDFLRLYPQKQQRLQAIMQNIVYKTYRWNAMRIDKARRGEYIRFMHDYFKEQQAAGLVKPEFFELQFYPELRLLLANPQRYLRLMNSAINDWLFKHNHAYHLVPGGYWQSLRDGAWYVKRRLQGRA
jgi:hypothetical protein